jgi:hypothetical protein
MEAALSSETPVNRPVHQTTQRHIPEDTTLEPQTLHYPYDLGLWSIFCFLKN